MTSEIIDIKLIIKELMESDNALDECDYDLRLTGIGEIKNKLKHGRWYYSNNGFETFELFTYIDGKIFGEYKWYFSNKLYCKGFKVGGKYNNEGLFVYYDLNSDKIEETGFFKKSQRQGTWKQYFKGKEYSVIYKDNRPWQGLIGRTDSNEYFDTEGSYSIKTYSNGFQNGEQRIYYKDGELKNISFYENGRINGKSTTYYKNGSIQTIGFWQNSMPSGVWTNFNDKGEIISTVNK